MELKSILRNRTKVFWNHQTYLPTIPFVEDIWKIFEQEIDEWKLKTIRIYNYPVYAKRDVIIILYHNWFDNFSIQ